MKFFKVKNPTKEFYCALCRAPRALRYERHLSILNYLQILTLTFIVTYVTYPYISLKGSSSLFIFWLAFEGTRKLLYRKDLPCPYCGFDPTWYRRDVRVARKKVEEFLKENPQISQYQFRATESTKSHDLLP